MLLFTYSLKDTTVVDGNATKTEVQLIGTGMYILNGLTGWWTPSNISYYFPFRRANAIFT